MVDDITKARWGTKTSPNDHKPTDALKMALHNIETGEIDVDHVIVVYHHRTDHGVGYFQAGDFTHFGAIGLLTRATQIMGDAYDG